MQYSCTTKPFPNAFCRARPTYMVRSIVFVYRDRGYGKAFHRYRYSTLFEDSTSPGGEDFRLAGTLRSLRLSGSPSQNACSCKFDPSSLHMNPSNIDVTQAWADSAHDNRIRQHLLKPQNCPLGGSDGCSACEQLVAVLRFWRFMPLEPLKLRLHPQVTYRGRWLLAGKWGSIV